MSSRTERVERRAQARRQECQLRQAASPARPHPHCLIPDCGRPAPTVRLGPVAIALCAVHKAWFDRRYAQAGPASRVA
ncbi:MAG TPA: hypothetical protein VNG13_03330 [Mycobacteriales bacterium]|nr:hypothetical protein [Mycobacteriales bacterium]